MFAKSLLSKSFAALLRGQELADTEKNLSFSKIALVIDPSPSVRYSVGLVLGGECEVEGFGEAGEVLGRLGRGGVDLVILGVDGPLSETLPFVRLLREESPWLPVLFLSTRRSRGGDLFPLSDVLGKPFFPGELRGKVEGLLALGERERGKGLFSDVVSPLEKRVRRWLESGRVSVGVRERVRELSSLPLPVLIEGEEGTGKRWVARGLHYLGGWKGSEFVWVLGRGLAREGFLEELRGRVRGRGVCRGLDVYIEGVEDLSWGMQGYLVRQVEEGWVGEELGLGLGMAVRVMGSSGEGFGGMVERGEVRRDFGELFWGERLRLKALRERVGEIGGIVGEVLRERGIGKRVSEGAVEELLGYGWPGNVEELEGLVVRTGMMVGGEEIGRGDWEWGFGARGERAKRGKGGRGKRGRKRRGKGERGERGRRDREKRGRGRRSKGGSWGGFRRGSGGVVVDVGA